MSITSAEFISDMLKVRELLVYWASWGDTLELVRQVDEKIRKAGGGS